MAFITTEDFKTHLKDYIIDAVSDNDESILQEAIDSAMQTAASYIGRFDVDAIYNTTGDERKPFTDLMTYIKDIAKKRFLKLANILTDWDVVETEYKNAIAELGKIQSGRTEPRNWPYPHSETAETPFTITSRPKRENHI